MNIIRLIFFFMIGYFIIKIIRRFISPGKRNPHVQGKSDKPNISRKRSDIQDIDYEDLEK